MIKTTLLTSGNAKIVKGEKLGYITKGLHFSPADKSGYDGYYEACLELLRPGGLLTLDNMFHLGRVAARDKWSEDTPTIDALNAKIKSDERVSVSMVPIGDGLTLCRKRP